MPSDGYDRVVTRTELFGLFVAVVASIVAAALATAVFLGWFRSADPYIGAVGVVTGVLVLILSGLLVRIYIKEQATGGGLVLADPFGIGSKIARDEEERDD